jgi:hypothetical protein
MDTRDIDTSNSQIVPGRAIAMSVTDDLMIFSNQMSHLGFRASAKAVHWVCDPDRCWACPKVGFI